jgi:hypothetical protein
MAQTPFRLQSFSPAGSRQVPLALQTALFHGF